MRQTKISAGSYDLNKFLFGGYETDIITTLYGPAGCGKTIFCILVAVSQAKKGNKVFFVDTEGGFSIDRINQILNKDKELLEQTLGNILLLKPTSFEEQELSFGKLNRQIKQGDVSLIIVDSMAMLYRLELADAIRTGEDKRIREVNHKLAKQLQLLNEIARKQQIPVIVTNQVYSEFVKDVKDLKDEETRKISMVGGDLLKYWSKCLIELQNYRSKRKIILQKHRSLPQKELSFEITNLGIRKRGLF